MTEIFQEVDRKTIVTQLRERDGYVCQYPGCKQPFDEQQNSRHSPTIDHMFPQAKARALGWTFEQIWDISNLQLMGRTCNSKKSDRIYEEDGSLPGGPDRVKIIKADRPVQCETCASGRLLLIGEVCETCGSGPMPESSPRSTQKSPKECTHAGYDHCWMCWIGFVERKSALMTILTGNDI